MGHRRFLGFLGICAATASFGATPSVSDLAACAGIAAANARLACYDALASRAGVTTASATSSRAPSSASAATAATAAPAAPSAAAAAASSAPAVPAATADTFGLPPAQIYKDPGPKSIEGHITSISADAAGHAKVVLDIGQTWTVVDDSNNALNVGDAVKIKRASLGSYMMAVGSKGAFRVRRSQ